MAEIGVIYLHTVGGIDIPVTVFIADNAADAVIALVLAVFLGKCGDGVCHGAGFVKNVYINIKLGFAAILPDVVGFRIKACRNVISSGFAGANDGKLAVRGLKHIVD